MEIVKLNETIDNMLSDKWEHRLLAEFKQVATRLCSLSTYVENLRFRPEDKGSAYLEVFMKQTATMHMYALLLLARLLDTNLEIPKTLTDEIFKAMGANPTTREEMRRLVNKAINLTWRDIQ